MKKLYSVIAENSKKAAYDLQSVLSVLENITLADSLFSSKVKKIFYYSDSELENFISWALELPYMKEFLEALGETL